MPNQDSPHRQAFRDIAAALDGQMERMATLTLRDEKTGLAVVAPLGSRWQPLPGRDGVRIFHVPDPSGAPGLYLTVCVTEPGAHYSGSVIDESRLLALMEGQLQHNGTLYTPGQVVWIAPGEPSTWAAEFGALAVIRYNVPPPDIDFSDIIRPIKP